MNTDYMRVVEEVRRLATENPDYVDPDSVDPDSGHLSDGCFYAKDGAPSCIIGHALYRTGDWCIDELESLVDEPVSKVLGYYPKDIVRWLSVVQDSQDMAIPWGQSVKRAESKERFYG